MLTLKDLKTGEVIANPSFGGRGSSLSSYSTSDRAVKEAINSFAARITKWLNNYCPLEANIIEQPEMWLWSHNRWKWGRDAK